jgi:Gram-negative bacterial TonB protein C-terminal
LIAERVFLAFDTGRGLAYVQVSGWQRTYLLWTFRNFRGVPHKILNARQHQLVEELYPAATLNLGRELDEDSVIGTVEDFIAPFPAPAPVSAAAKKATSSIPGRKLAQEAAPSHSVPLHSHSGRLAFSGPTRTVTTVAVIVITAFVTWQQLRTRPVVSAASAAEPLVMQQSRVKTRAEEGRVHGIVPTTIPAPTNPGYQPLRAAPIASGAPIVAVSTPAISGPQRTDQVLSKRGPIHSVDGAKSNTSVLAGMHDGSALLPPMQILGPPQKLVYPACPDSNTRGKVSLQALVGYDGMVSHVRVLKGNRLLAAAAKRAIREWRYQPFPADAQKLEREARITISFISEDVVAVSFPDAAQVSR